MFLESVTGGCTTDRPCDVTAACKRYGTIRPEVMSVRTTVDLMAKVMATWKQT